MMHRRRFRGRFGAAAVALACPAGPAGAQPRPEAEPAAAGPDYARDPEAAGVLAEWDGKTRTVVERRQFTEVTGPGGLEGSPDDHSPLWAPAT